jgi:copper resistance protein B
VKRLAALFALSTLAHPAAAEENAPWGQAAAYGDPGEFAKSRRLLITEHGAQKLYAVIADRFEYRTNDGAPALLVDGEAWRGGDRDKLKIKVEAELDIETGAFGEAELQALFARAIGGYFDIEAGIRRDVKPDPSRTYGVIGLRGLAPFWFDIDAALFVSGHGDVSARLEAEYDLLLTQRLILEPRTELDFAATSVPELGVGAGLSTAEVGARLRYEIRREFAPYVGVEWSSALGDTADFARAGGEEKEAVSFVAGVRFWF